MNNTEGRLKRVEYKGKNLRVSRTGGVALRHSVKVKSINVTANTNQGLRLSKRISKGTQVGFQNGQFLLRGRYEKGPAILNLSKSGVTVSSKNKHGTYNWVKPKRSSFTFAGVNVRGKKAVQLHIVYLLMSLLLSTTQLIFTVIVQILTVLFNVTMYLLQLSTQLVKYLYLLLFKREEQNRIKTLLIFLEEHDLRQDDLKYAILYLYLIIGSHESHLEVIAQELKIKTNTQFVAEFKNKLSGLENSTALIDLFSVVSSEFLKQNCPSVFTDFIFKMDEVSVAHFIRTEIQETAIVECMKFNDHELESLDA
tara:strand:+ start:4381 stop:5310 length:930 start_codon:yes stop_codon:yes gene_type:complete